MVDDLGTYLDALSIAGELAGLGGDPNVFEAPREKGRFLEMLAGEDEESELMLKKLFLSTKADLFGKPLALMPGVWAGGSRE